MLSGVRVYWMVSSLWMSSSKSRATSRGREPSSDDVRMGLSPLVDAGEPRDAAESSSCERDCSVRLRG